MTSTDVESTGQSIVAKPAKSYRIRYIIMFVVCVAMGGWFGYDGIVGYPAQNEARQNSPEYKPGDPLPHTDLDITFQKALMVILPIAGIALLAFCLYQSRGKYRLEGTVLHVPGHPPIQLESITTINKKKWDRKGIAYLTYEQGGTSGVVRIDDFAYERQPTDEIFKRIEQHLTSGD